MCGCCDDVVYESNLKALMVYDKCLDNLDMFIQVNFIKPLTIGCLDRATSYNSTSQLQRIPIERK